MVNYVLVGVLFIFSLASCCKAERLTFEAVEHTEEWISLSVDDGALWSETDERTHYFSVLQCLLFAANLKKLETLHS